MSPFEKVSRVLVGIGFRRRLRTSADAWVDVEGLYPSGAVRPVN
jgi:hypothetical protein